MCTWLMYSMIRYKKVKQPINNVKSSNRDNWKSPEKTSPLISFLNIVGPYLINANRHTHRDKPCQEDCYKPSAQSDIWTTKNKWRKISDSEERYK